MRSARLVRLVPVLLFPLGLLAACGPESLDAQRRPRNLPFLAGLQTRIAALPGDDGEWIRDYLAGGGTLSEDVNERRLSGILGRMLHADPPEEVAAFVEGAERHLHEEFFHAFSDAERRALSAALIARCGEKTVKAEKYAAVLAGSGGFPATLELKLRSLPLEKLARPASMTPERVLGTARAARDPLVSLGAAEVLVAETWVLYQDEQHRRRGQAAARMLLDEAAVSRPDDPALAMSRALFSLVSDVTSAEFLALCRDAAVREPENGAYPYLAAYTLAEAGRDAETVGVVQRGMEKPFVCFHEVGRARAVAAFLRAAGLGPVGSRLAAYSAASVDGPMRLSRLGQLLRQNRSAGLALAAAFPRRLAEQLAARPRMLTTEQIRLELVIGSWEWSPDDPSESDRLGEHRKELAALEAGMDLACGPGKWDDLLGLLGEERFLRYVDDVLFGGEDEFLRRCAGFGTLAECARVLE